MAGWYVYLPIFLALYVFTKHLLNRIHNLPPSPFPCLPIIGHLYLLKKPLYRTLSKIANRNGPVLFFKFGSRPVLVVSSPSAAEECFTKNDIVFANRPRLLIAKYLGYNYTALSWAPYGDHWRNLRRIASIELLSTHRLQLLSGIRMDEVRSLMRKLLGKQDEAVEFKRAFFELTFNVMMRMIAGKRYYGCDNVEDMEEARRFREIQVEALELSSATNLGDFLPWLKSRKLERRLMECGKKRDKFMQDLIEQHRRKMRSDPDGQRKKTMIEILLSLQESESEYYTDEIIRGLMLILMLAGTETTINTMEWALSLLLNHPEVLAKAQNEIFNTVGHERLIDESDLVHLPYLHSIISETLRMYQPVPMLGPHEASEECIVGGFRVPSGTMLLVNIWAIQNDPKIFEDPTRFKPERFEGVEGARDGFKLMPFGAGRRGCPGEGLGLRIVGLTLGSLIQCFEWSRVHDKMVDMRTGTGFTMPKAQPLQAKCRPRSAMLKLCLKFGPIWSQVCVFMKCRIGKRIPSCLCNRIILLLQTTIIIFSFQATCNIYFLLLSGLNNLNCTSTHSLYFTPCYFRNMLWNLQSQLCPCHS